MDPADTTLQGHASDPAPEVGAAALATALEAEARPEVLVPHPRRDYVLRRALAIADLLAVSLALLLAFWISPVESRDLGDAVWFLPLLPVSMGWTPSGSPMERSTRCPLSSTPS